MVVDEISVVAGLQSVEYLFLSNGKNTLAHIGIDTVLLKHRKRRSPLYAWEGVQVTKFLQSDKQCTYLSGLLTKPCTVHQPVHQISGQS